MALKLDIDRIGDEAPKGLPIFGWYAWIKSLHDYYVFGVTYIWQTPQPCRTWKKATAESHKDDREWMPTLYSHEFGWKEVVVGTKRFLVTIRNDFEYILNIEICLQRPRKPTFLKASKTKFLKKSFKFTRHKSRVLYKELNLEYM